MLGTILILGITNGARAEAVYLWRDDSGLVHYGDNPPPRDTTPYRVLNLQTTAITAAAGLRSGERKTLRRMERRNQNEHRRMRRNRLLLDSRRAGRRRECEKIRIQLLETRDQTLRKQYANILRQDC